MGDEGSLIFADGVMDDIRNVHGLLSREGLNHFDAHVREWAGFAHRDGVSGEHELSLRQAMSAIENRGYRVDRVQGVDYYSLTYGQVGSFVARLGEVFVVLWFGRSMLSDEDQKSAKKAAARRLGLVIKHLKEEVG